MADDGGSSRGSVRGGRGGGSTRGGRRRNAGGSRQQPTRTRGSHPTVDRATQQLYRPIFDETTEKIGRDVSELVVSGLPDDCPKLEVFLAQTHKKYPAQLRNVFNRNTSFAFPQGPLLAGACSNGKVAAADILLRYGADPNKQCPSGSTALHLACYNGKVDCVKLLLGLPGSLRGPMMEAAPGEEAYPAPSPADPRVTPPCGTNALIHACRGTDEAAAGEIADALLKADATLVLASAEGALALHAAAASGFPRVLEKLLSYEHFEAEQPPEGFEREAQLAWINRDNLVALQVAEQKCETEMTRERENQQRQQRRGGNGGGSRGGRGGRNGGGGGGGGGRWHGAGRSEGGGGGGGGGGGAAGSRDGDGDSGAALAQQQAGSPGGVSGGGGGVGGGEEERREVLEGGWGCVVVLMRASPTGIRQALHGSKRLKSEAVRDRILAHLGLHALLDDVKKHGEEAAKGAEGGDKHATEAYSDFTMSIVTSISTMYKAVIKPARGSSQAGQIATSSQLLAELMRPRDGHAQALTDENFSKLLDILINTDANPHVVRPLVLMLTDIANDLRSTGRSAAEAGAVPVMATFYSERKPGVSGGCCQFHQLQQDALANAPAAAAATAESVLGIGPGFHTRSCLCVWENACACIVRLGKMLLYGLQGQQEGENGEVLYEREGALFDAMWELVLRFLVPFAGEAACFLAETPAAGKSPTHAILTETTGKAFSALWTGLGEALSVVEGVVGGTEPDRFGALLRGYLSYLHLTDESLDHYNDLVKVINDNKVETGLAGGGDGGARRIGNRGRNPKNILSVIAAEASLGIPEAFAELVVEQSEAIEEILDADPGVLENRLSVLLRIEGAVETPQKLDYIVTTLEARAGRSKGLELSINRMAEPHEMVEMAMQQLAAAPPKAMGQRPELKFMNEQGEGDGPMREMIDLLSEVFRPRRTIPVSTGRTSNTNRNAPGEPASAENHSPQGLREASHPWNIPPPGETGTVAAAPAPAAAAAAAGRSTRPRLNPSAAAFPIPGGETPPADTAAYFAKLAAASLATVAAATRQVEELSPPAPPSSSSSSPPGVSGRVVESTGGGGGGGGGGQRSAPATTAAGAEQAGSAGSEAEAVVTLATGRESSSGFWKCFPLFRAYEPDPAAVVPRAAAGAGAGGGKVAVAAAKAKEDAESRLRFFRAAGRLISMSLVSGTPLGVVMPDAVWAVLLGSTPSWEDFCGRDKQYLESMRKVLAHEFGQGDDGNGMELYFSVSERGADGKVTDVPLLAGGESKRVTDKNKQEFVNLATRRRALGGAEQAISALRSGMSDVIPKNLLSVLLPPEVASIVSGPQGEVDLAELQANIWYVEGVGAGGFGPAQKAVQWFWEWAKELKESDRRKLLMFWSGSSRVPPFGFEDDALNEDHRWAIDKGPAVDACPTASTCDRRMTLPQYSSKEAATKFLTATIELGCTGYTTV